MPHTLFHGPDRSLEAKMEIVPIYLPVNWRSGKVQHTSHNRNSPSNVTQMGEEEYTTLRHCRHIDISLI
jgi:hypothetical protein